MGQRAAPRHGKPSEAYREHDGEQGTEPEIRHRDTDERQGRRRMIDVRAGPHGGDDAERNGDQHRRDHRRGGELERRRQPLGDSSRHRLARS